MYANYVVYKNQIIKRMAPYMNHKNALKQPQVTLVVPGGALGMQARPQRRGRQPEAL